MGILGPEMVEEYMVAQYKTSQPLQSLRMATLCATTSKITVLVSSKERAAFSLGGPVYSLLLWGSPLGSLASLPKVHGNRDI